MTNASISANMRRARIAEHVAARGKASVGGLAARYRASAETIRRDLVLLADAGQLRKVHGGARALPMPGEGGFAARMRRNAAGKRRIAAKLAGVVQPGQTLFIDTGSTTLICAQALARVRRLTVITNATAIAEVFAKGAGGADVYLLGGRYRPDNAQTVGADSLVDLGQYRADMAVLTVGAINSAGIADFSHEEARIGCAMAKAASALLVVADHSKFDKPAPFVVAALGDVAQLVCDTAPGRALRTRLAAAGVETI